MKYFAEILLALVCSMAMVAGAESLQDPTRPPLGINDPAVSSSTIAYPPVKGLQSVIISPSRCAAIIDGKTVELGAVHGKEILLEVGEHGVIMLGSNGKQRSIRLFPAVGMKMTEILPLEKQTVICKYKQKYDVKNPAIFAGKKERQ
jgi:hypothetical protein